jgi:hypothetical protein
MVFAVVALTLAACGRPGTGSGKSTREVAPRTSITPVRAVTVTLEAATDSQIAAGASGT